MWKVGMLTDGVSTSTRAGVTASGATESGRGLRGGIRDGVSRGGASALESVEQTNPVTSFVSEGLQEENKKNVAEDGKTEAAYLAQVVGGCSASWNGRVEHDNTIVIGGARVAGGEG